MVSVPSIFIMNGQSTYSIRYSRETKNQSIVFYLYSLVTVSHWLEFSFASHENTKMGDKTLYITSVTPKAKKKII